MLLESGSLRACGLSPFSFTGTSTGLGRAGAEPALENGKIVVTTACRPASLNLRAPVDVVFNNAGKGDIGGVGGDGGVPGAHKTIFWGAVSITREAVKCFRETNPPGAGGRLIQMSSYSGIVGLPGMSFYGASKFALEGASEALAAEIDPAWNIKVTIIEPGWIRTEVVPKATWSPEHPAYQNPDHPTSQIRRVGLENTVTWKDAKRSAEAFYKIAGVPNPPLHFVVGKDAIEGARKKIAALAADIDTYERLSEGLEE
ncbi:hypothetical protein V8D89_007376 [Ganoderma adspersum]